VSRDCLRPMDGSGVIESHHPAFAATYNLDHVNADSHDQFLLQVSRLEQWSGSGQIVHLIPNRESG
jgi:hypothetical protein